MIESLVIILIVYSKENITLIIFIMSYFEYQLLEQKVIVVMEKVSLTDVTKVLNSEVQS